MKNHDTDDHPKAARVWAMQQLLFPSSARMVCDQIGLNWWAALKLRDDGWISFDLESGGPLDDGMEEELRFVGSLVVAGCDPAMLSHLLRDLERPYRYRGGRIYYDWSVRRWRMLPERMGSPESVFSKWIEELKDEGDVETLKELASRIEDALSLFESTARQGEAE